MINTKAPATKHDVQQTTPKPPVQPWAVTTTQIEAKWNKAVIQSFGKAQTDGLAQHLPVTQHVAGQLRQAIDNHEARSIDLTPGREDHSVNLIEWKGDLYHQESGMGPQGQFVTELTKIVGYKLPAMPLAQQR